MRVSVALYIRSRRPQIGRSLCGELGTPVGPLPPPVVGNCQAFPDQDFGHILAPHVQLGEAAAVSILAAPLDLHMDANILDELLQTASRAIAE